MSDFLGLSIFGIPKTSRHIPIIVKYMFEYQYVIVVILPE